MRTIAMARTEPAEQAGSIKPSVERERNAGFSHKHNTQARVSGRQCAIKGQHAQTAAAHFMGLDFHDAADPSVPLRSTLGFMLPARESGLVE